MFLFEMYHEVSADELTALGVMDVMCTPADGTNRNTFINWSTVRLAIAASFEVCPEGKEAHHSIVLNGINAQGHSVAFGTEELPDGTIRIATVSGWHLEGRAKLNAEQSAAFKRLVDASIAAGRRY